MNPSEAPKILNPKIAVIVPCYNEEVSVASVVKGFKMALPQGRIIVFDNNSQDQTRAKALEAGAEVILSRARGKGNVVRHSFRAIDADVYLMVDGDDTYNPKDAPRFVEAILDQQADMVVGTRLKTYQGQSFRRFHIFGNHLVAFLISRLFSAQVSDILSGYRAFSRDFVKSVPLSSTGFEIETELTLQAVDKGFSILEIPTTYSERTQGSVSKLRTYRDGALIIKTIFTIFKNYNPLVFFSILAGLCAVFSLASGILPILDFVRHHYVYHVPLAILAAAFGILSILFLGIGLILDTVIIYQRELFALHRLRY